MRKGEDMPRWTAFVNRVLGDAPGRKADSKPKTADKGNKHADTDKHQTKVG